MKTVTEKKSIFGWDFGNLDGLIEQLNAIRAKTNVSINVTMSGSLNHGYQLQCTWERPMTEEEIERDENYHQQAEEAAKDCRRKEYEKLKAEFEAENEGVRE